MEKDTQVENGSNISIVLTSDEAQEVRQLAGRLGVSLSHIGRALLRVGLQDIERTKWGNKKAAADMLLSLVKLGK